MQSVPSYGIWYGELAPEPEWSSVVLLESANNDKKDKCSGVIIDQYTILTAGHCIEWFLSSSSDELYISHRLLNVKMRTHPQYTPTINNEKTVGELPFDIGFIKVEKNILNTISGSRTATLPHSQQHVDELIKTSTTTAIGLGPASKNQKKNLRRKLQVSITHYSDYIKILSKEPGKTLCQGDSGGGLFAVTTSGPVLLGIQSAIGSSGGCGATENPGYFVPVLKHLTPMSAL